MPFSEEARGARPARRLLLMDAIEASRLRASLNFPFILHFCPNPGSYGIFSSDPIKQPQPKSMSLMTLPDTSRFSGRMSLWLHPARLREYSISLHCFRQFFGTVLADKWVPQCVISSHLCLIFNRVSLGK